MEGKRLSSKFLTTDVTCVIFYENHVLAGVGNSLSIFEVSTTKLKAEVGIFNDEKIHGICPGTNQNIAIFGGRLITIITLHLEVEVKFHIQAAWRLSDWVLCAQWLNDGCNLAVATAHNAVTLLNWKSGRPLTVYCEEKCILYSALLVGDSWEKLTLLAGTVFREVVIWSPHTEESVEYCPVAHRLVGHQGVIFSITYNANKSRIYTTSDDRSVRVWEVAPAHPMDWKCAQIRLIQTLFGHIARVWRSVGITDITVSIGEDSHLCMWNNDGCLLRRWSIHQGGSIWSIDSSENLNLIVTAGGDGGISLWPLDSWKDSSIVPAPLNFQSDLLGEDSASIQLVPRRVVLLSGGNVAAMTDSGCLLHCLVQDMGQSAWTLIHRDDKLANYCLLEVSPCRQFVALANLNGHILIFVVVEERSLIKLIDTPVVDGKIFSVKWLSPEQLLTCGGSGRLELWNIIKAEGHMHTLKKVQQFLLPPCKERWITSILLQDTFLLCGDRAGNIHLYNVADTSPNIKDPCETLLRVHGRLGVTSLASYANYLYSTGRDGTVQQYQLMENEQKLQRFCAYRVPMDWVALTGSSSRGQLVVGFSQTNFVVWSQQEQRVVVEVPCGGGHRSWDCSIKSQGFNFVHIRGKQVHLATCRLDRLVKPVLQVGFHIKNVNCIRLLHISDENPIFISGGEDTTVRITNALDGNKLHLLSIQRTHISSVRALTLCQVDRTRTLLFSAGGRAQMKVWQLTCKGSEDSLSSPLVVCQELTSHMLKPSNCGQRIPWKMLEPTVEPETRYMSICAIPLDGMTHVLVLAGCSDGLLRLFCYNLENWELELVGSFEYHNCCILNVSHLFKNFGLSMATDGQVALWDFGDIIEGITKDCKKNRNDSEDLKPFFKTKVHQSGINSHDLIKVATDTVLLATGGDDNAIMFHVWRVAVESTSVDTLMRKEMESAHSAQITGLAFLGSYLVSTSIDQRVQLWQWHCEPRLRQLDLKLVATYCSTVADIQGLQVWSTRSCINMCVYGRGMEIVSTDIPRSEQEIDDLTYHFNTKCHKSIQ